MFSLFYFNGKRPGSGATTGCTCATLARASENGENGKAAQRSAAQRTLHIDTVDTRASGTVKVLGSTKSSWIEGRSGVSFRKKEKKLR